MHMHVFGDILAELMFAVLASYLAVYWYLISAFCLMSIVK